MANEVIVLILYKASKELKTYIDLLNKTVLEMNIQIV